MHWFQLHGEHHFMSLGNDPMFPMHEKNPIISFGVPKNADTSAHQRPEIRLIVIELLFSSL